MNTATKPNHPFEEIVEAIVNKTISKLMDIKVNDGAEVLNQKEAASFLKVSLSTFQKYMKAKDFPTKSIGKRTVFVKSDLVEWLKKRGA